jgi:DNA primase
MSSDFVKSLKRVVKIEDVLSERGVSPSKSFGSKLIYKCPIHSNDDSPSFHVYQKENGDDFFCYGCKVGGDVVKLVTILNKCSNRDAFKILGEKAGISYDPYLYSMDLGIGNFESYDYSEDLDSLMLYITMTYRKLKKNGDSHMVCDIEKKWADIDNMYWSMNCDGLKNICSWINGK